MKMVSLLFLFGIGFVSTADDAYMTLDMAPTLGPEKDTVYQPGTPGGSWTDDEVAVTRRRIFQMIHPHWSIKTDMYGTDSESQGFSNMKTGITENTILRLVFHDCIPYADGTGGCDGCLNWHGMGHKGPAVFGSDGGVGDLYNFDPMNATDNNGLSNIVEHLELLYTTIDWPFQEASLDVSLQQSGKSRADLWQLAGLVALERSLERANRACDLDYHGRQQVTLLEGRDKCEIKLNKPLKFLTGRTDCVSDDPDGRGYVTTKPEDQPKAFGDATHVIDYGRTRFGMDVDLWTALQSIHSVVHGSPIGVKYTWFGMGYLSNMYFKLIANKPKYRNEEGGDLSFGGTKFFPTAVGDTDGNPVAHTGWRASCMFGWNTTEGGPCFLRPTADRAFDGPNSEKMAYNKCLVKIKKNGKCKIDKSSKWCSNAKCTKDLVMTGQKTLGRKSEISGPWSEDAADFQDRHNQGWNNQFALPYEVGLYWNFTVGGVGQRAIGCPGLDEPFGTVDEPNWPHRNTKMPIFSSPAMQCDVNTYAPDGKPMHEIVDELASDNELWAEKFLEGWQQMTSNGYASNELVDGPQSGWVGHYSLTKQGIAISDFEAYIADNAPVTFTDPEADPFICGHMGHVGSYSFSCGIRFSTCFKRYKKQGYCKGYGENGSNGESLHYDP